MNVQTSTQVSLCWSYISWYKSFSYIPYDLHPQPPDRHLLPPKPASGAFFCAAAKRSEARLACCITNDGLFVRQQVTTIPSEGWWLSPGGLNMLNSQFYLYPLVLMKSFELVFHSQVWYPIAAMRHPLSPWIARPPNVSATPPPGLPRRSSPLLPGSRSPSRPIYYWFNLIHTYSLCLSLVVK